MHLTYGTGAKSTTEPLQELSEDGPLELPTPPASAPRSAASSTSNSPRVSNPPDKAESSEEKNDRDDAEMHAAALKIQRVFRGHLARRRSSIQLQSAERGDSLIARKPHGFQVLEEPSAPPYSPMPEEEEQAEKEDEKQNEKENEAQATATANDSDGVDGQQPDSGRMEPSPQSPQRSPSASSEAAPLESANGSSAAMAGEGGAESERAARDDGDADSKQNDEDEAEADEVYEDAADFSVEEQQLMAALMPGALDAEEEQEQQERDDMERQSNPSPTNDQ